jgi:hypothetical protein
MLAQSNKKASGMVRSHGSQLYLSVKTLGAFSNWQADMKVNRQGRNPALLMGTMNFL